MFLRPGNNRPRGASGRPSRSLLAALIPLLLASPAIPSPGREVPGPGPGPEPQRLLAEGLRLERLGRFPEAADRYREALDLSPESAEGHSRLGTLLARTGYRGGARRHLEEAVRLAPERPELRITLARIHEEFFDHEAALDAFRSALELGPGDRSRFTALVGLGQVFQRMGRFDRAEESFRKVLEEHPRSPAALVHLGILHRKTGNLAAALRRWEEYLQVRPGNSLVASWVRETRDLAGDLEALRKDLEGPSARKPGRWIALGDLLRLAGDADGALEAFSTALERGAGPPARRRRAEVLQARGAWREAAADLAAVLREDPEDRTVLYRNALGWRRAGDCRGEEAAWRKLVRVEHRNPFPYRMLLKAIRCAAPEGGGGGALARETASLKPAYQEDPEDPWAWLRLALIREEQGRPGDMFEALRRSFRSEPNEPFRLRELRRMVDDHPRETGDFIARFQAELRTPPRHVSDLILFGYLARLSGSPDVAGRLLGAVLEVEPASAPARVALANGLEPGLAPEGGVEEELDRALEIDPEYYPAHLGKGMLALQKRRPAEAAAAAKRLLALRAGDYHSLGILGSARMMEGALEPACNAFRDALEADPTDPEGTARFQLAVCLGAVDRRREARRVLQGGLPWSPEDIYRQAWQLVRDYYVDRSFHGMDWQSWRHRFDGRMEDNEAAYGAVAEMLASLGNRYTRIRRPEETVIAYLSERGTQLQVDPLGRPLPTSSSVVSEDRPEGIRYLRLTNFSDPGLTAELRKLMRDRRRQKGLILDLRGNPGGSTGESEMVGSLFLEEGEDMGEVVDAWGRRRIKAGGEEPIDPEVPVVVLVDENTGSAAESLAGALRGTGRARVVGRPTRGKGAAQVTHLLPGGAMVLVTTARNVTPGGREIEGRGILPDVELNPAPDRQGEEEDPWIEAAEEILRGGPSRSRKEE